MDIATVIRAGRQQTGTSIRELAAMAGISYSYLSQVEAGKSNPTTRMAANLLSLLGYTLTAQRATQTTASIAAARKALNPACGGRWCDEAQQWQERYQKAGWVDAAGKAKPAKGVDLLLRVGRTTPVNARTGAVRYTPDNPQDTWLDIVERIDKAGVDYALTGGPAANQMMSIGGNVDPVVYVENLEVAARVACLTENPAGRTTLLPFDGVCEVGRAIYPQGIYADNVWMADIIQIVIDCAGNPDRGLDQAMFLTGGRI
ncbi:MAG: helix-turn-helix domain-containing protein [Propionibacteriaceae bacterium]|nr:helix-turn-helix domain-containing protein [Propionibacteriaceae bacterium]